MAVRRLRVAEPPPHWTESLGGDLPDLNVWLALVVAEHPRHAAARRYWDGQQAAPAGVGFMPDAETADAPLAERLASAKALPARLWTDAWLSAVADGAGLRLVTFDAEFQRLGPARLLRLQP